VETAEAEPADSITLLELRELVRGLGEESSEDVGPTD
jgi:hypothetical protein